MTRIGFEINRYFRQPPRPAVAFQITSHRLSGIRVSSKDRIPKSFFLRALNQNQIIPSFSEKNITDLKSMEKNLEEAKQDLRIHRSPVALLLPDLCLRTFVFSFSALPKSPAEREAIIRFRVKKKMPLLAEDSRLAFSTLTSEDEGIRVIASIVRNSVVREYEDLFGDQGMTVKQVGIPLLALYNLLQWSGNQNIMLLNIEPTALSLMAVLGGQIVWMRQKSSLVPAGETLDPSLLKDNIIQEVETSVHYIEDHEQKKIDTVRVRFGTSAGRAETLESLKNSFAFSVEEVSTGIHVPGKKNDLHLLSPLLGLTR